MRGWGGCGPRIEVIVIMQKKKSEGGGCEPRIEVIVKIQKKKVVGNVDVGGGGDVNQELKLLCKMQKFEAPSCNNFGDIMITNFQNPNLQREIIRKK